MLLEDAVDGIGMLPPPEVGFLTDMILGWEQVNGLCRGAVHLKGGSEASLLNRECCSSGGSGGGCSSGGMIRPLSHGMEIKNKPRDNVGLILLKFHIGGELQPGGGGAVGEEVVVVEVGLQSSRVFRHAVVVVWSVVKVGIMILNSGHGGGGGGSGGGVDRWVF